MFDFRTLNWIFVGDFVDVWFGWRAVKETQWAVHGAIAFGELWRKSKVRQNGTANGYWCVKGQNTLLCRSRNQFFKPIIYRGLNRFGMVNIGSSRAEKFHNLLLIWCRMFSLRHVDLKKPPLYRVTENHFCFVSDQFLAHFSLRQSNSICNLSCLPARCPPIHTHVTHFFASI